MADLDASNPNEDERELQALGYRQELLRRMSGFSNYAISLSIICILAGGITSFHLAFCAAGGAGVALGWPLGSLLALAFAATMGQLASAFPTAGGLYHWAAILRGRGWGWATAWFNLAGLITVLAAINVGTYRYCQSVVVTFTHWKPDEVTAYLVQLAAVLAITFSQAGLNHLGIRVTTWLTDVNGYLILVVSVLLTAALLFWAPSLDFSRLVTFTNFSGTPAGDDSVWPASDSMMLLFALGLMLPMYTITGFDASAHTSEETLHAAHAVPRGIIRSVWVSGLFGWFLVSAAVLAVPDLAQAANQGENAFVWTMTEVLPPWLAIVLGAGIAVAQYCCGLAAVTSTSRMMYAFARDGGTPFSHLLRRISATHRVPGPAIWTVALLAVAFTVFTPVYSTITSVCVIFLYISYMLPTLLGLWAYERTWRVMGPWSLGRWYRPLAVVCLLGGVVIYLIGIQPPNRSALWITLGAGVVLAFLWFGFSRKHFPGPPVVTLK